MTDTAIDTMTEAERVARCKLIDAITALHEAEENQRNFPTGKRYYSYDPEYLREDLVAGLAAAGLNPELSSVQSIAQMIQDRYDIQVALHEVLKTFGPVTFGALVLFSMEAGTSLSGHCESMSLPRALEEWGFPYADLRQPADALNPEFLQDAAPNTLAERKRIGAIRDAVAEYKAKALPLRDTSTYEEAVDTAAKDLIQALTKSMFGKK